MTRQQITDPVQCGIYAIKCTVNNKVYVGQSIDIQARWKQHQSGETNKSLRRDMIRYGIDNFAFSVIELCETEDLNEREYFWINHYSERGKIYNSALYRNNPKPKGPPSPFQSEVERIKADPFYGYIRKWSGVHQFLDLSRFVVHEDEMPQDIREKTQCLIEEIYDFLSQWRVNNE